MLTLSCPLWVKSRHVQRKRSCPLYPESGHSRLSLECSLSARGRTFVVKLYSRASLVELPICLHRARLPKCERLPFHPNGEPKCTGLSDVLQLSPQAGHDRGAMMAKSPPVSSLPITTASFAAPFRHSAFVVIWTATLVSNVGGWMYGAASGWLMTSLNPDPLIVALVQAASTLPICLFAIPAGALADIFDKRRYLIVVESVTTAVCAVYASWCRSDWQRQAIYCCSLSSSAPPALSQCRPGRRSYPCLCRGMICPQRSQPTASASTSRARRPRARARRCAYRLVWDRPTVLDQCNFQYRHCWFADVVARSRGEPKRCYPPNVLVPR